MSKDTIKLIVTVLIILVFIGLIVLFTLVDLDLGFMKTTSIESLLKKYEEVSYAEKSLGNAESALKTSIGNVTVEEQNFKKEKTQYEAISNETIETIKEATTTEKYSIEYMWVRLGNYAKKNNLSIVITEPNGKSEASASGTDSASSDTQNTSTTTTDNQAAAGNTTTSTLFKLQVTGTYINVSDFVFEVENDKELRFRLDNIVMESAGENKVRATFNVKDLVINK